jgi:hypothetical protein
MDKLPESTLFQAAFAAMLNYLGNADDLERAPEEDGALVMQAMQARTDLERAEGPAAGFGSSGSSTPT